MTAPVIVRRQDHPISRRNIDSDALKVLYRLHEHGHVAYLVGGSVRDALLGREQDDLDFTTDAHPPAVLAVLEGWAEAMWDTGIAFGTVGARRHGTTLEITTFRADAYDRVSRNPVVAFGDSLSH